MAVAVPQRYSRMIRAMRTKFKMKSRRSRCSVYACAETMLCWLHTGSSYLCTCSAFSSIDTILGTLHAFDRYRYTTRAAHRALRFIYVYLVGNTVHGLRPCLLRSSFMLETTPTVAPLVEHHIQLPRRFIPRSHRQTSALIAERLGPRQPPAVVS